MHAVDTWQPDSAVEIGDRLRHESTTEKVDLFRYWDSLRDGGLPDYRRFDALDIPHLLGDLAVVDVERPAMRYRFRLYGTRIVEVRGKDLTGQCIGDPGVFSDELNRHYLSAYQEVTRTQRPVFDIVPFKHTHRSAGHYHRLLLPFTDGARGQGTCDVIVLSFQSVPLYSTLRSTGERIGPPSPKPGTIIL